MKKEDKKPNSFADRIKNMSGGSNNSTSINNKPGQPKPPAAKRGSAVEANINKFGAVKKNEGSSKATPANSFGNKLSQLNEMFKKQGFGQKASGGHRPSMIMGMPQNFKFGKGMPMPGSSSGGGSKGSEIIKEEPDKMKAGYDPAANLQKTLDSVVVVKKDKKKKKKPVAFNG